MKRATVEDLPEILEMIVDYYIENQSINKHGVDFDVGKARSYITTLLTQPDGICFVADDGVVLGNIAEPWFGHRKFANGWVLYVRPRARNGLLARALLHKFEESAPDCYVSWQFYNDTHKQLINGLMRRLGYQENGFIFTKDQREG